MLPTTTKIYCWTTSRNLNVQICCTFLYIKLCSNKRQLLTHGGNFHDIASNYQDFTDHSVSLWRMFLTQKQIVNHVKIFFHAGTFSCAATVLVSLLTAPVSLNFFSSPLMLLLIHHLLGNSFINSVAFYPYNLYTFLIKILSSSLKTIFTHTVVMPAMT